MSEEELLNITQVAAKVNLTQYWIYERIKAGTFPAGVKIGSARLWKSVEIDEWLKQRATSKEAVA